MAEALPKAVAEAVAEGCEEGAGNLARLLRERGVDPALLDEALADMRAEGQSKREE